MDFGFPTSPKLGDKVTFGSTEWTFTGSDWIKGAEQRRGRAGATGATGATGPAGATGPVEEFVASINGLTGGITTDGLTFAFAGISVGAFGITTDGAISFSGTTGTIEHPALGNDGGAVVDIKAGGVVLGRFARFQNTSTIGDVDQSSHGTRVEVTTKTETVDVYADNKLHLHGGVLFPESGISLGVGLTFPDGTFQSSAHAPHEFVASFNGATGAVSTTDLTLEVAGISASGGITTQGGLANISSTNKFRIGEPGTGFGSGPFEPLTYSFPTTPTAADSDGKNPQILVQNTAIVPSSGDMPLSFAKIGQFAVNSFNGATGDVLGVANGVATFTISASSAIATGQKTDSLHRFPYNATLTNIDVKVNGSGGFTAGAIIAGPDFGNPATSSLTGGTLGTEGTTGSSTLLNNTSVTAGGFLFFDVISNASGSTQAQMFVTYETR